MTALGVACSDGTLEAKNTTLTHDDLGLPAPAIINGKFVKSVTATGASATTATVTIVYSGGIPGVTDGDNLVYTGTCAAGSGLSWAIAGTVPARLQPKI
jgi:hypothetical protein